MKSILTLGSVLAVAALAAETPRVDTAAISFSGAGAGKMVKIEYTLTGEPAVVTIDLQTNTVAGAAGEWVSIGGEGMGELGGEANKVVYTLGTPVAAYWQVSQTFGGAAFSADNLRAVVTAWPTNSPPDWMVVDLKRRNMVRWYATTNHFPGGFNDLAYKTTKLAMRKVPAKGVVWLMGSPVQLTDPANATTNNVAHRVMLTYDYYAGIYEVTQAQYVNMGGVNYSKYANEANADVLPVERIAYSDFRGGLSTYKVHTRGHEVLGTSLLGRLREHCGIADMDLPTEAEWEYACRAGSATELYCDLPYTAANVKSIAWTRDNASKPREVGTSRPNAWGIYDMIGNVWELCLDAMGTTTSNDRDWLPSFHDSLAEDWATGGITVDPIGASNSSGRIVKRGGSWYEKADLSFSTNYRSDGDPSWASGASGSVGYIGARLFCSVPAAVK